MQEYIEKYLDRVRTQKAHGTFRNRRQDLKEFDRFLAGRNRDVLDVTSADIDEFLVEQAEDLATGSLRQRYASLKVFFGYLKTKQRVIETHPMKGFTPSEYSGNGHVDKPEIVYIEPAEIKEIARNVNDPVLRNELLVKLLYHTGMRRKEVVNVRMDDIDRDARAITITDAKSPEKSRVVFYQPSLDFIFEQWADTYRHQRSPYLFPSVKGGNLSPGQITRIVRKAAENAGIQEVMYEDADGRRRFRITAHVLRHSHAISSLRAGISIQFIRKHLGHESIEVTQRYLKLLDQDTGDAYRAFPSLETSTATERT